MGQQQLLLIIVGIIIVGLSLLLVIKLFEVNALEANRDAVYADTMNLAGIAQHYYQLPKMISGGGGSFVGFVLPEQFNETGNGSYTVSDITANSITIIGVGKEHDKDGKSYQVTTIVTPTRIQSSSSILQ